jgi:gliotoxin/aspirochlorine biosynthesis aminotransferase
MAVGLALASNTTTSSLSSIFVSTLLTSRQIPRLLALNSDRLAEAYTVMTAVLQKHNIPYLPAYAGLYLFARIDPTAQSWEDESKAAQRLKDAGVLVSAGQGYHSPEGEKGWARIGFAVGRPRLEEAILRLDKAFTDRAAGLWHAQTTP